MWIQLSKRILEEYNTATEEIYKIIATKSYRFIKQGDVSDASADIITTIEKAIDKTQTPFVYNYDLSNTDNIWKIRVWILSCDCDNDIEKAEAILQELDIFLPADWKIPQPVPNGIV